MGVRERRRPRKDGRLISLVKLLLYIDLYCSCALVFMSRVYQVFMKTLRQSKNGKSRSQVFSPSKPVQEKPASLGLRLTCKTRRDGQGKDIYWTDANNLQHRMIVLVPYRQPRHSEQQAMTKDWTSIYQVEDSSYIFEGLKMSDRELNLWLQGWNLDALEQLEKGGGHSPA